MNERNVTRIVAASDQPIFLRGLAAVLGQNKDVSLVGLACSGGEALQLCQMTAPDVLVLDLRQPVEEIRQVVGQVCEQLPAMKVVLLLREVEQCQSLEELNCQPLYIFSRDINEEEFDAALKQVCENAGGDANGKGATRISFEREPEEDDGLTRAPAPAPFTGTLGIDRSEQTMAHELAMAGKIQADLLPEDAPVIRGWDIAATLAPARDTSGDFYDFIPLAPRKWGIVVADVSDKGMGAALLMAFSSTLFRTFAMRFPTLPAVTLSTISERMLSDTRGGMFITAFFGILEPHTGRLVYANAGHPPGFLITNRRGRQSIEYLRPTGMALGVSEQARWRQRDYRMEPGDFLVLYTDGITDAQNPQGAFYQEERLLEAALARAGRPAREVLEGIHEDVQRFVGGGLAQDDVALIVIRREEG